MRKLLRNLSNPVKRKTDYICTGIAEDGVYLYRYCLKQMVKSVFSKSVFSIKGFSGIFAVVNVDEDVLKDKDWSSTDLMKMLNKYEK